MASKVLHPGSPLAVHALSTLHESDKGALVHAASELAHFDSRSWVGDLGLTAASVITTHDHVVPVRAQEDLVALLHVPDSRTWRMEHGHLACLDHDFGQLVDRAALSVS